MSDDDKYVWYEPHDVAEWHDLLQERDQWKEKADYWKDNADMWRLRANKAKNLAQDLATILRALRRRGQMFSLKWDDDSAVSWHNLPQTWKDYISRG